MQLRNNQRGVAMILVLGAIAVLSALATDFGNNSQVQLRLAVADSDRLQAEYLARSSVNLLKLLMAKERAIKSAIDQLSAGAINPSMPLCKQFPLSTELLRGLYGVSGGAAQSAASAEKTGEERSPEAEGIVSAFDTAAAQAFLSFRGDFDAECQDESSKFNLNVFANLRSTEQTIGGLNKYDRHKYTLKQFLLQPSIRKLFSDDEGEAEEKIDEVVRNLADWVDNDTSMNDRPGVQSGAEDSLYSEREGDMKARNGKMVTLDEAYLVAGVADSWFAPLRPYFTVYGQDKINICTADRAVVEALITSYSYSNERIPPIRPDNRELFDTMISAITLQCAEMNPSVSLMTQIVESVLMGQGVPAAATPGVDPTAPPPTQPGGQPAAGGAFSDLITLDTGPFRLIGTGRVGGEGHEVSARIEVVIDTKDNDPKKWKVLYWRAD